MDYHVYELLDPRDGAVFYVGKGTAKRFRAHVNETIRWMTGSGTFGGNTHKLRIVASLLRAGKAPDIRIVLTTQDPTEAYNKERELIALYGPRLSSKAPGGEGGRTPGFSTSEEVRGKIRSRLRGRKLSAEHVAKMIGRRPWNKGEPCDEATRRRMREAHLGQRPTGDTLKKRAESLRRNWQTQERRAKAIGRPAWNKGLAASLETRKKISDVQRGRVASEETRGRMSEAQAARHQSMTLEQRESLSRSLKAGWKKRRLNG